MSGNYFGYQNLYGGYPALGYGYQYTAVTVPAPEYKCVKCHRPATSIRHDGKRDMLLATCPTCKYKNEFRPADYKEPECKREHVNFTVESRLNSMARQIEALEAALNKRWWRR